MQILLISGISGSGKSVALNVVEDTGYFCVDNLPPSLLPELIETLQHDGIQRAAIAIDSRSVESLAGLPNNIEHLKAAGHEVKVLFLTASTESLVARFSETRRSHPLSHRLEQQVVPNSRLSLVECILLERELLVSIQFIAHEIDTSDLSANQLRGWVRELLQIPHAPLTLMFESFAYKIGVPLDADLVFDVRMLPNPFYDTRLRPLTGKDQEVILFLSSQALVQDLYADIRDFVEKWLPSFKRDNRSYVTVAIGCTGGQHRSVYMVEQLADYFKSKEQVLVRHRRIG
jgi:UPF0042 nucleotide-binding protein